MDDVWSKPLSVAALTQAIKHYSVHQPSHTVKKTEYQAMQINESLLDNAMLMLKQYLDLVWPQLIHQSVAMFEQMMPGYLIVLDSNMTACDQKRYHRGRAQDQKCCWFGRLTSSATVSAADPNAHAASMVG